MAPRALPVHQAVKRPDGWHERVVEVSAHDLAGERIGKVHAPAIPVESERVAHPDVVPVLSVPFLMLFKYGKPRGYLKDIFEWHTKPRIYCGIQPDSQINLEYVTEGEVNAQDYRTA